MSFWRPLWQPAFGKESLLSVSKHVPAIERHKWTSRGTEGKAKSSAGGGEGMCCHDWCVCHIRLGMTGIFAPVPAHLTGAGSQE